MVIITNEGRHVVNGVQFTDGKRIQETLDRLTLQLETPQGIVTTRQPDDSIEVRPISGELGIFEKSSAGGLYKDRVAIPFNDNGYQAFQVKDTEVRLYH